MTDTDLMSDEAEAYLRGGHRRTKAHQFDEGISCECMRRIGHSGLMGRALFGGLGARPVTRVMGSGPQRGAPSVKKAAGRPRSRVELRRPQRLPGRRGRGAAGSATVTDPFVHAFLRPRPVRVARRLGGRTGRPACATLWWPAAVERPGTRAIGSAGERLVHTEEVTGSIPVSPTQVRGRLRVATGL
jgi:hypothetical protein